MLVGIAMGLYQLVLQCVMCAIWGNGIVTPDQGKRQDRWTLPGYILLIPPVMLCLTNVLQEYLQGGAAGNFVATVNGNLFIDPFRGLIATSIVSIVAIARASASRTSR